MITSRTRAFTLLGAAFLLGLVAGGVVMALLDTSGAGPGRSRASCEVRNRQVCFWAEELQLTPEQQESVLVVYRQGEATMDSVHRTIRPAMDSIYQTIRPRVDSQRIVLRALVRPHLNQQQRERYDSIVQAWDENRRHDRERSPNGGPPRDRR